MNTPITQVYVIYSEIPSVTDVMNVKIGISIDTDDRLKTLQTSNPFKLNIIKSFDAGREANKHEKHFHDLYEKYNTSGEWFKFETQYFEDVVLPEMYAYFSKIEVLEGDAIPNTKLSIDELLEGVDDITDKSEYVDKKIAIVKLTKAMLIADENKKLEYQQKVDKIKAVIHQEYLESRKISLEKHAVTVLKRQAYAAKKRIQDFAFGYLVGCASITGGTQLCTVA